MDGRTCWVSRCLIKTRPKTLNPPPTHSDKVLTEDELTEDTELKLVLGERWVFTLAAAVYSLKSVQSVKSAAVFSKPSPSA